MSYSNSIRSCFGDTAPGPGLTADQTAAQQAADWAATQAALKNAPLLNPATYAPNLTPSATGTPQTPSTFVWSDPSTWYPASGSSSNDTMLYVAVGAVALWLLLRKKR